MTSNNATGPANIHVQAHDLDAIGAMSMREIDAYFDADRLRITNLALIRLRDAAIAEKQRKDSEAAAKRLATRRKHAAQNAEQQALHDQAQAQEGPQEAA